MLGFRKERFFLKRGDKKGVAGQNQPGPMRGRVDGIGYR
jgi:hypothetical protein